MRGLYPREGDLATAHLLGLDALKKNDRLTYNVGTGNGASVRNVVEAARKVTGHPIPAVMQPRRAGDPAILVASSDKLTRELKWKPRFSDIEKIIETAWDWHREHPEGYRSTQKLNQRPTRA